MRHRRILKKYVLNNLGYKILALCFAFILWLVVLNITDPDYTKNISGIKVQVINEDKILDGTHVYTISSGETTSVSITGKKSVISNISANDILAIADLEQLSITNAAPITVELTGDKMKYAGQVTINPKDTNMVINLENMTAKTFPVEIEYRGELADNIVIDEANLSPKKVTVSAPESVTNSVENIIVSANYGNINSDTTMYLTPIIKNTNGSTIKQEGDVSLDETQIYVEFKVSYKKSVPIRASVMGEPAEGYTYDGIELSQDTFTVKGSQESLKTLYRIVIPSDVIDIEGKTESFTVTVDVTPYLPENVVVYGESPTVDITVNISGVEAESAADTEEQAAIDGSSDTDVKDIPETSEQAEEESSLSGTN